MKTRGVKTDYVQLAGLKLKKKTMTEASSPDHEMQIEDAIILSSGEEDYNPDHVFKTENVTDEEELPLNVRLTMRFAETKAQKSGVDIEQPTCSKYLPPNETMEPSLKKFKTQNKKKETKTKQSKITSEKSKICKKKLDINANKKKSEQNDKSDTESSITSTNSTVGSSSDTKKKKKKLVKFTSSSSESEKAFPSSKRLQHHKKSPSKSVKTNFQKNMVSKKKLHNKKVNKKPNCDSDTESSNNSIIETSSLSTISSSSEPKKKKKNMKKVSSSSSESETTSDFDKCNKKTFKTKKVFTKKKIIPKLKKTKSDSSLPDSSDSDSSDSSNIDEDTKHKQTNITKKRKRDSSTDSLTSNDDCTTKAKVSKKSKKKNLDSSDLSSDDSHSSKNQDDFISELNETTTKTSRDLKAKIAYKLIKLKISNETGFNGLKYKKATAVLQHPKTKKMITILMPRPVANYSTATLREITKRIKKNKNPSYIVKKITSKKRPDNKGHYDLVDFKWC